LTVLSAIVLIALILRVFFAYGISADSGFALSGGSDATYHLRVIEHILTTGSHLVTDPALNYPFGGLNYNPPLFDWSVAVVAYPLTFFGYSPAEAASIALALSTAVVGALTCIPLYLMVKEMFNRRAAIVAAAFFAISSVAIVKTVFSNGTESAYFVFFFVLMTLFLLRAVKALKRPEADASLKDGILAPFRNKAVLKNLIFATLSLVALQLSWIGFFSVILMISFIMLTQTVLDRLRGVSAIGHVSLYGSVMLFALLISSLYYALAMGMVMLIAGPLCLALLLIFISVFISRYRVWVISIPVSIAVIVVVMLLFSFLVPTLYEAMTSGTYVYADGKFGSLLALHTSVTLSTQAIYAGMVTMWFSFIVAGFRLVKMPKKLDSPSYLFITMWFIAMIYLSWRNIDHAYLAAPMYAAGTGVVIVWVLSKADIKGYIANFKGSNVKSVWRKIIKPVPFVAIVGTVLMLLLPNALYAVDASIPSNQKADFNADMHLGATDADRVNYLGATNYYIKDSDWTLTKAWEYYSAVGDKDGALVTWLDYGAEAIAKGGFEVVSDAFGGGTAAASNILLGTQSGSVAAMAVRLILYEGALWDDLRTVLGPDAAKNLDLILFSGRIMLKASDPNSPTASVTDHVKMRPDIYGPTDFNVSEENAKYLTAIKYLTGEFTDLDIAKMYAEACKRTEKKIGYIGVTGNMLPVYYGDNSTFSTMAYLNEYHLDSNGSPSQYYTAGVPYYGYYYTYTDAMYETMIWKALVGMSLNDYRAMTNDPNLSASGLLRGLMLSDGTYAAYPGFGMSNFVRDGWWVMYNPDATLEDIPSDKWILIPGEEAQARQAGPEGGLINYLGGMAFLKYVGSGDFVSGTVKTPIPSGATDAEPVSGVTVAIFDSDGNVVGVTRTNKDGRYGFMVDASRVHEIGVYSGSAYAMEIHRQTAVLNDDTDIITIEWSELSGTIVSDNDMVEDVLIELTGRVSGNEYSMRSAASGAFGENVVPDTYSVTMTLDGVSVYTGTFTLYPGSMDVGKINIRTVAVEVTVRDRFSTVIPDAVIEIRDVEKLVTWAKTDDRGVARMSVAPGDYTVKLEGNEYNSKDWMLVSSSSTTTSTSFKATLGSTSRVSVTMVECVEVEIDDVKRGDIVTLTNGAYTPRGAYTITAKVGTESGYSPGDKLYMHIPVGDYESTKAYSAKKSSQDSVTGEWTTSYAKVVNDKVPAWEPSTNSVEIKMTDKGEKAGGIVSLIREGDGLIIIIPMSKDDDDNPRTADLPDGVYTVYAYAYPPEKKAFIGKIDTTTENELTVTLQDAIAVSGEVRYTANTTIRLTYVPIEIKTDINGLRHTIWTATDSLGAYYMMLPRGYSYHANTEPIFGYFMSAQDALNIATSADTGDRTSRNLAVNPRNTNSMDPTGNIVINTSSAPTHTITNGTSTVSAGGIDVKFVADTSASPQTLTITFTNNNRAATDVVLTFDQSLTVSTTGAWLTYDSTTGEMSVNVLTGANARTVSATFTTAPPDVEIKVNTAPHTISNGTSTVSAGGVDVEFTANTSAGTLTITFTNNNKGSANVDLTFIQPITVWTTGSWLTYVSGTGRMSVDVPGADTRTVSATFTTVPTVDVKAVVKAAASHTISDGTSTVSAGGVDVRFTANTSASPQTLTITFSNNNGGPVDVVLKFDQSLTVSTTGSWLTYDSGTGEMSVNVPSGNNARTVSATFTTAPAVDIKTGVKGKTTIDGIEFEITAINEADGKATIHISNTKTHTAFVYIRAPGFDFGNPGSWLTAVNGGAIISLTSSTSPRTVNVTFDSTAYPAGFEVFIIDRMMKVELDGVEQIGNNSAGIGVDGDIDTTVDASDTVSYHIGTTDIEYMITAKNTSSSPRTVTVVLTNNSTTDDLLVRLYKAGVTFKVGDDKPLDEIFILIEAGETEEVILEYTGSTAPKLDASVMDMSDIWGTGISTVRVSSGNTVYDLDRTSKNYTLPPGAYTVTITPSLKITGYEGYYYSGTMNIRASTTEFDVKELIKEMTVIALEVDKDDKVSVIHRDGVTKQAVESKNSTDTRKIYYIPKGDLSDYIIIVENDDNIAYIDLGVITITNNDDIAAEDHMGEKVTISGYVGRVASGEMKIEMTVNDASPYLYATYTIRITSGEFEIDLPKSIDGHPVEYEFSVSMTDTVKGEQRYFTADRTVSTDSITFKDGKATVNMLAHTDTFTSALAQGNEIGGTVKYDATGDPMQSVTIAYTINDVKGSVTTDINGYYVIPVPATIPPGTTIEITEVTKSGYIVTSSPRPSPSSPLSVSAGSTENFTMSYGVEIDNLVISSRDTTNPAKAKVDIKFEVTNLLDTTVVLFAGSGWSRPSFDHWDATITDWSGTPRNYVVIPAGATNMPIKMEAQYDAQKLGAGSEALSVQVRSLLGNVLQTNTLDIYDDTSSADVIDLNDAQITSVTMDDGSIQFKENNETILTVTVEGNRVSKHEYGFAATFTSSTDKWIKLNLSLPSALVATGWYVSIVDENNVILGTTTINLDGNATAVYYVRLISMGDTPAGLPEDMALVFSAAPASYEIELDTEPTNLSAGDMKAMGNNIFDSLNGMPTIVWVFAALSMLMVLLILWLGMRRGVFSRKR
jgi:asparagine N-glycosylation enzyme membrane subunit Stt3